MTDGALVTQQPQVSAVVCSYNSAIDIERCLSSITRSPVVREIVIVDNCSTDATSDVVREFAATAAVTVHLQVNATNVGFSRAINQGAAQCRGECFLILNPDAQLEDGALDAMMTALLEPGIGMVGPTLVREDGTLDHAGSRKRPTLIGALLYMLPFGTDSRYVDAAPGPHVDAVSGACMLITKANFEAIGGFDERFWMYGEDLDLCLRLRQRGGRIRYVHGARVTHFKGGSNPGRGRVRSPKAAYAFYQALGLYYYKHGSAPLPFRYLVYGAASLLGACSACRNWARLRVANNGPFKRSDLAAPE